MKLLLDTHAPLWALSDVEIMAPRLRALIEDPGNAVLSSVVSLWEIVVKARIGKLDGDVGEIAAAANATGMELLSISLAHLKRLQTLPAHHRDPFDHLLIAQALQEDATFVSDDRHVAQYRVRHLRCSA